MIELRDGSLTDDPRLDRLVQFDERSRQFAVGDVLSADIKSKTWRLDVRNDQGRDGACVGFGTGHRLAADPIRVSGVDYGFSMGLYNAAKKLDPWEGEDYEGTSVLAGIKAARNLGLVSSYRWCFSVEDIMRAVSQEGPVIVGTNWHEGMFDPRPSGLLDFSALGKVSGGHCYLIRGLTLSPRLKGESKLGPCFRITNSWSRGWGVGGDAFVRVEDYERHLMTDADQALVREVKPGGRQGCAPGAKAMSFARGWWNSGGSKPWTR